MYKFVVFVTAVTVSVYYIYNVTMNNGNAVNVDGEAELCTAFQAI